MKEIKFTQLKRAPKKKFQNRWTRDDTLLQVKKNNSWNDQQNKWFKINIPLNKPAAELIGIRKNSLEKYKLAMAYLSKRILVDITLTDYQQTLLGFLVEKCPLVAMTVRKFAAVTIMELFHQILPDRKVMHQDKHAKLTDEVRETYKNEDITLQFYMKYLKGVLLNLEEANKNKKDPGLQSMETTMVMCLSDLFVKHPRFNYNKDLLTTLSPYICSPQKTTREIVFKTLVELLSKDQTGEMSLQIVKSIYTVVMKKRLNIHQDAVKVLYHLRLEHLYNIDKIRFDNSKAKGDKSRQQLILKRLQRKKGHTHYSKKEQKEHKMDMYRRDNKWMEDKDKLIETQEQNNSDVLQLTLGIYFLILKKKPKPLVISAVFEGLARYAHLINIGFFIDLLNVMDEFFASYRLKLADQLFCIQTVFTILQSQSESLAIDPYRFYIHLYNLLPHLSTEANLENLQLTVNIFNMLFLAKRTNVISVPRILALMKRICSIACNMPNHGTALTILSTVSKHFTLNQYNEILLDTDQHGWPGKYTVFSKEPDTANAGATSLWELSSLRRYYHPHVKKLSNGMIRKDIYKSENSFIKRIINRCPKDLHKDYNLTRGVLNPGVPSPEDVVKTAKKSNVGDSLAFCNLELYEQCMEVLTEEDNAYDFVNLKRKGDAMTLPPNKKQKEDEVEDIEIEDFSLCFLGS